MAIPRMFNSNTPFIEVKGGSGLSFVVEENGVEVEEENNLLTQTVAPPLSLLMEHGTAKQVGTGGQPDSEETPYVSIIAQAEGEECQEFSPTSTEYPYSRAHLPKRSIAKHMIFTSDTEEEEYVAPRRPQLRPLRRKHRKRPHKKTRRRDEGGEPPVIQGLWVQEIDWLRSTDKEATEAPDIMPLHVGPQHPDRTWNTPSTRGYSLEGVSKPWKQGRVSATCNSYAVVPDDARGRNDVLFESGCGPGEASDSSRSSEALGVSESLCSHESESDTSICRGVVSDSVCSIADVSDCLSRIMCVSDNFSVQRGAPGSLMGVSDMTSTCGLEPESGSAFSGDVLTTFSSLSLAEGSGTSCCFDGVPNRTWGESESVKGLRGKVTQRDLRFASTFFKEVVREALVESDGQPNEGLVFHKDLRVCKSEYREGKQYHILHHIQNGSYGDVFCVQDKSTGFECAAKRIPLSRFSSEEVSTWSVLNSPRVVELFGAVREGLNITLFMDLKPGCLAQLLRERGSLPEDLALHYLHQLLGALEHLHHRHVLHLDVKVDNVLLSVDGMDTFLCDFGLSETMDSNFQSTNPLIGPGFPGTESHMAPEVARGDLRSAKADVWSSCCMLLHMLNGCHPWIRYYSHPLCLKIVSEPAPLWEVPASCNHFTAEVFRAGLQKDPIRRASATDLKKRTTHALRAVGGLCSSSIKSEKQVNSKAQNGHTSCRKSFRIPSALDKQAVAKNASTMQWVSPWRASAAEEDSIDSDEGQSEWKKHSESESDSMEAGGWESHSSSLHNLDTEDNDWEWETDSEVDIYLGEEDYCKGRVSLGNRDDERDYEGDLEEEETEWDSSSSTELFRVLQVHFPVLRKGQPTHQSWGSELELEYLRDGVTMGSVAQTPSPEPRDHPPSCLSNTDDSYIDATDKDSDHWSDDLSSGVFSSYNSQTDGHVEWLLSTNQMQSHCFEGVDIWIENIGGECLRIRERRQVKVGHVAIGISEQITAKAFSMETLDRKTVSFQQEIQESGLWLRCVPAPDGCQLWNWRIREGRLEIRDE